MQPRLERAQAGLRRPASASALPRLPARAASPRCGAAAPASRRTRTRRARTRSTGAARPRSVCRYCCQKCSGTATPVHISSACAARHPSCGEEERRHQHRRGQRPATERQPFYQRRPRQHRGNARHVRVDQRGRPSPEQVVRAGARRPAITGTRTVMTTLSPSRSQARPIGVMFCLVPGVYFWATGSKTPCGRR